MAGHFADRLCVAIKTKKTPLVVGLDPVYSRLPDEMKNRRDMDQQPDQGAELDDIFDFCTQTLQIAAPMVPAVKINIAFFERYFWDGIKIYYALISKAKQLGLEVIGDVKRGDIGHTAQAYAVAHLGDRQPGIVSDTPTPDAITVNAFAGAEAIEPFANAANRQGKGIFVWVRSSNPSAAAVQDFADANGKTMYEKLAEVVAEIASQPQRIGRSGYSNVGMVVGGTSPEITTALRQKYDKIWFLVPGYGSQGASAKDCVRFCRDDGTGALINASRSIIYAYEKPKYKEKFGQDWKRAVEQALIDAKMDLAKAMQTLI